MLKSMLFYHFIFKTILFLNFDMLLQWCVAPFSF